MVRTGRVGSEFLQYILADEAAEPAEAITDVDGHDRLRDRCRVGSKWCIGVKAIHVADSFLRTAAVDVYHHGYLLRRGFVRGKLRLRHRDGHIEAAKLIKLYVQVIF